MDAETPFRDQLFEAGLLIPTGVDGLYGRSGTYELVVEAVEHLITRLGAGARAEIMRFPPGLPRTQFEQSGYLKGFPHLAGTVHCFCGNEAAHRELLRCVDAGEDWSAGQSMSDIVLTPAACYPIYPVLASRGRLPAGGALIDVASFCFRHEPSLEPTRQQMFRMREYVRIGTPTQVLEFRGEWLERMTKVAASLGMPHQIDVANDPFFGRAGKVLAESQRQQALKFELMIPVNSTESLTACTSFNYHMDHFSQVWELRMPDDSKAHTACIGFGVERLTLALFRHHGLRPGQWPERVRTVLWP